jgi:DDE superfamily endonuclease
VVERADHADEAGHRWLLIRRHPEHRGSAYERCYPPRPVALTDRVGMASGRDRAFYSGKHKAHGLNVQVIADPIGRLVWISPPLPGARHDMGAAREHGIIDAITNAEIPAVADTAYQGAGPPWPFRSGGATSTRSPAATGAPVGQPERRQRRPRPPARTGRTGQRRVEELEDPAQDPIQPEPGRRARRRSSDPHDRQRLIRLAKAQLVSRAGANAPTPPAARTHDGWSRMMSVQRPVVLEQPAASWECQFPMSIV